ncbi:hypothetical protein [Endozoicomonas numazuensis]|nr:hypothetical protein [Endozoicomonas numazuensis]
MDANGATFVYNGAQYVPFVEPGTLEKATQLASEYLGMAVTGATDAANYINGVVAPYVTPVTSKIVELQNAAAGQLPEAVTSTLGQEVTVKGVGSATAGTVAAVALPSVLPIVNYIRKGLGRSFELSGLKSENQKALDNVLAQSATNINDAIETADAQIAKANLMVRKHKQNAKDSFFSFKNILKHTVTVLAPFCVLPQVGFAVAGTAAVVGLTARAVTHVLNYRGEASQAVAEQKSASSLRQLRNRLQELKDTTREKVANDEIIQEQNTVLANTATLVQRQNDQLEAFRNRLDEVAIPIDDDDDDLLVP